MLIPEKSAILLHTDMNILYIDGHALYASNDHIIFKSEDGGRTWDKVGSLPKDKDSTLGLLQDRILRSHFVRKMRRNIGINQLVVLRSKCIVVFYDRIYRIEQPGGAVEPILNIKSRGLHGPLMNGICVAPNDEIYWGEYNCQKAKHRIRIVKGSNDGREWDVCYEFDKGSIGHIHSLSFDHYRNKIIICTGDRNDESHLFFWDYKGNKLERVGGGDQSWRTVSVLPTENYLIWGTDAGRNNQDNSQNHIYRLDLRTGERSVLRRIDNPAYFSQNINNNAFIITTTYENQPENDVVGSIWYSRDTVEWNKILSLKYRKAKTNISNFGIIRIPSGNNKTNTIYYTPYNLDGHFNLYKIDLIKQYVTD